MVRIIDLFAGIGGFRLGFQQAADELGIDLKCVFSNEIDKSACDTYEANFEVRPDERSIEIIDRAEIPDHDILMGGFPCQPFSHAGKQLGFNDPRGTLIHQIVDVVAKKRPKFVVLENVPKIMKHYDKNVEGAQPGDTIRAIRQMFHDLEYSFSDRILNSLHYGVRQNRKRVFIVCYRDNIGYRFRWPTADIKHSGTIAHILEPNPDSRFFVSEEKLASAKRSEHVSLNNESVGGFTLKIIDKDTPYVGTLTTQTATNHRLFVRQDHLPNSTKLRRLTPHECSLIQGFPEEFKIVVSDNQAYKQFGNAVTVPVVKAIAKELFKEDCG